MFEKCGLRDIFYHIWKHKFFIFAVSVCFFLVGCVFSSDNTEKTKKDYVKGHWVASASYLVSDASGSLSGDVAEKEISLANTYSNILKADFSSEAIYNNLLQEYTAEELVAGLSIPVSAELLSFFDIKDIFFSSVLAGTSIVNFYVYASDKELAENFLSECIAVFESIPSEVPNSSIQYLDGVVAFEYDDIGSDAMNISSDKKYPIVMLFVGIALSLVIVLFRAIFYPTINRKSDFSLYDIPILGDMTFSNSKEGEL